MIIIQLFLSFGISTLETNTLDLSMSSMGSHPNSFRSPFWKLRNKVNRIFDSFESLGGGKRKFI